jgi:hypothetical protein
MAEKREATPIKYHDGSVVILEFQPKKHWYSIDGEYVPATTAITNIISKPALIPWAANEGAKFYISNYQQTLGKTPSLKHEDMAKGIRKAHRATSGSAINIGVAVHKYAEEAVLWKLERGPIPSMPDGKEIQNAINAFREWVKQHDINWLSSEEQVYNRVHGYAGTVDAVAEVDGEFCVIDWKTSKAIYSEYHLQCAAYAKAVEDIHGREIECAYVLRCDKFTGDFEAAKSSEIEENFRGFLGALTLYKRLTELENRNGT